MKQPQFTIDLKKSARKELEALSPDLQVRIVSSLENLSLNPFPWGSLKLKTHISLWRIRVGNYRIVYEIRENTLSIYVIKIAHRKDIYRDL